ncbi:MAG TPA: hypothetical protein VEF89_18255 [Solirubrobacteraceae bacterium]|nr:hypothetical protein [Solirubrobacteraceae bacterium]
MVALAAAWVPALARADGDPASDVLVSQSVFLPADAGASVSQQSQLSEVLDEAQRDGFPIRVALIASPSDLGSVTPLWGQPSTYAQFLGEELSLVYHGRVLVVMPRGFGVYQTNASTAASSSVLARLPPPGQHGLAQAAVTAVQQLAAASGHSLSSSTASRSPSPSTTTSSSSSATITWIVFAIGAGLIAAAWIASLRARPLGSGRGSASSA